MQSGVNCIRVSLVEDCLLSRISLKHSLSLEKNIEVVSDYDTCEECIKSLNTTKIDVILMDLDLNGMNGIEATCLIKQKFPKIKVVIITNYNSKDAFAASMFFGANAFILKNLPSNKISKIIEFVHNGAFFFDPDILKEYGKIFPKPDSFTLGHLYNKKERKYDLTVRELEVLKLVAEGKSNTEIAKEIIVSTNTAKAHVGNILTKMNAHDRASAAVKAVRAHIID